MAQRDVLLEAVKDRAMALYSRAAIRLEERLQAARASLSSTNRASRCWRASSTSTTGDRAGAGLPTRAPRGSASPLPPRVTAHAPPLQPDADRVARFERQARLLASLNHPLKAMLSGPRLD